MNALNKEILRLAIPSILANITVPIVGMVDIAVAGHLHGSDLFTAAAFIGGISIGSMLFDLLYWNFAFLRVGTGGLTAQAFGRGDRRECARILMRALDRLSIWYCGGKNAPYIWMKCPDGMSGWEFFDLDGDDHNWVWYVREPDSGFVIHEGLGYQHGQ